MNSAVASGTPSNVITLNRSMSTPWDIIDEAQIEELLEGLRRALDDGLDHARKQKWI